MRSAIDSSTHYMAMALPLVGRSGARRGGRRRSHHGSSKTYNLLAVYGRLAGTFQLLSPMTSFWIALLTGDEREMKAAPQAEGARERMD